MHNYSTSNREITNKLMGSKQLCQLDTVDAAYSNRDNPFFSLSFFHFDHQAKFTFAFTFAVLKPTIHNDNELPLHTFDLLLGKKKLAP